jgi:hypothetical protein
MAIAIDVYVDHMKAIIGKSFWHWDTTTQQNPAQGACLGDRG